MLLTASRMCVQVIAGPRYSYIQQTSPARANTQDSIRFAPLTRNPKPSTFG